MTAQAQEDGQAVEASPPPMEAVESHPATLATEAQARAMAQALYSKALRTEMADGFSEALPLYLNVLKVDPHFIDLQIKVAHYYLQENDSGRALELLEKAAAVNPQSAEIQATMAGLLQNSGRFDQALASAHAALALQPENAEAHRVVFEVLRDLNRLPEALANAKAVPQIKCSNPRIWMELARTYLEIICASTNITKEDLSALISPIYERAFALGDPSAELLAQRADYSLFVGKKEEALQYFERATEKGEPNAELYIRLAHLQSDLGHNKEALKSYEAAYDLSPDLPLLREQLAYQYVLDGQEQKAIDFLEAILRKSPTRAGVYAALGDLYQQAKQLDKAEQNYHEAIILDSSNFMNYYKMAGLMLGERRLNEAANLLTEARNRFPANARVAFIAAIVQRELKNSQQALDLFAQAKILADDKDNDFPYADYFYELSLAQEEAGKPLQSEDSLREGLNLEPNNEDLLNALAYLWAEQGKNLPKALEYSKRSLQIAPGKCEFLDTLGWIYFKMGRYQEALPFLEKAVTQSEGQEEVLGHLAEVHSKLGQIKEALAAMDKILAKTPDNAVIREKYEKLKKATQTAPTSANSVRD